MQQNQIPALPEYVCHKRVKAAKIVDIIYPPQDSGSRLVTLVLAPPKPAAKMRQAVPIEYMQKHKPEVGGYFVRYADGYSSYSPAKAFEEGYSLVPDHG